MLKSKLFYAMVIAYVAILGLLFGLLYPSVSLRSVVTVLTLFGVALAAVSYYLVKRLKRRTKGRNH